jgi:type III secretory pathway component EscS
MISDILIVLIFAAVMTYIWGNKTLNIYIKLICVLVYLGVSYSYISKILTKYLAS